LSANRKLSWRAAAAELLEDTWSVPRFEQAAERCGLHRAYYSGIERGVRNVSNPVFRGKGTITLLTGYRVRTKPPGGGSYA